MDDKQLSQGLKELDYEIRRLEFELFNIKSEGFGKKSKAVVEDGQSNKTANPALKQMLGFEVDPTYTNAMRYYLRRCPNGTDMYKKAAYRLFLAGIKKNDNPKCRFGVALCKYWGHGTELNHQHAGEILRDADCGRIEAMANNGDADAIIIKYQILKLKLRLLKDSYNDEAQSRLLSVALCTPSASVFYFVAMERHSYSLLESAARMGSVAALIELGDMYYYGKGYKPFYTGTGVSLAKAREFYGKGRDKDDLFCKKRLEELEFFESGYRIYAGALEKYVTKENKIDTLVIPDAVSRISKNAFDGLTIGTLILPDTVTFVSEDVFLKCRVSVIESNVIDAKKLKAAIVTRRISKSVNGDSNHLSRGFGRVIASAINTASSLLGKKQK